MIHFQSSQADCGFENGSLVEYWAHSDFPVGLADSKICELSYLSAQWLVCFRYSYCSAYDQWGTSVTGVSMTGAINSDNLRGYTNYLFLPQRGSLSSFPPPFSFCPPAPSPDRPPTNSPVHPLSSLSLAQHNLLQDIGNRQLNHCDWK